MRPMSLLSCSRLLCLGGVLASLRPSSAFRHMYSPTHSDLLGSSSHEQCSQEAVDMWHSLHMVLHKDKHNGHAYLRCADDNAGLQFKVSCKPKECLPVANKPQVPGQKDWCFVPPGCGYSWIKPCAPLSMVPKCPAPLIDALSPRGKPAAAGLPALDQQDTQVPAGLPQPNNVPGMPSMTNASPRLPLNEAEVPSMVKTPPMTDFQNAEVEPASSRRSKFGRDADAEEELLRYFGYGNDQETSEVTKNTPRIGGTEKVIPNHAPEQTDSVSTHADSLWEPDPELAGSLSLGSGKTVPQQVGPPESGDEYEEALLRSFGDSFQSSASPGSGAHGTPALWEPEAEPSPGSGAGKTVPGQVASEDDDSEEALLRSFSDSFESQVPALKRESTEESLLKAFGDSFDSPVSMPMGRERSVKVGGSAGNQPLAGSFRLEIQVKDFLAKPVQGAVAEVLLDKTQVVWTSQPTGRNGYTHVMCPKKAKIRITHEMYTTVSRPFDLDRQCGGTTAECEFHAVMNPNKKSLESKS